MGARRRRGPAHADGRDIDDRVPQTAEGLAGRSALSRRISTTTSATAPASANQPHHGYRRDVRVDGGTETVPAGGASRRQMPLGEETYSRSSGPTVRSNTGYPRTLTATGRGSVPCGRSSRRIAPST